MFLFAVTAALMGATALTAQDQTIPYFWDSHIVQRVGTNITPQGRFRSDTNRFDITIPLFIPDSAGSQSGLVIRGAGQILAPRYFFPFYDGYYNGDSVDAAARDQDYVDQFKGVQEWSLDSVRMSVFHNSDNQFPNFIGQIDMYRLNTDYSNRMNTDSGIAIRRGFADSNFLMEDYRYVLGQSELQGTITQAGAIVPTTLMFDPPIEFGKDESAMIMYINDFADRVEQPIGGDDDRREWQRLIGYMEYQNGDGSTTDPYRNPVPRYMVHGMILRDDDGAQVMRTSFRSGLVIGGTPYHANFNVIWFGSVVLNDSDVPELPQSLSVRYHFGVDASDQGLAEITPNPVREEAVIPFTLSETAQVTVELYTADGRKVETLLQDKKYVAGKYTIHLGAEDLENGAYLVRMAANGKNYSTKFVVAK